MNNDWKQHVTIDMFSEQSSEIAEVIGVEATLKLCESFGGANIRIPILDTAQSKYLAAVEEQRQGKGIKADEPK